MKWDELTPRQRAKAKALNKALDKAGVIGHTVSHVAKFYDEALEWDHGQRALTSLCQAAGWTPPEHVGTEPGTAMREALREALASVRAARPTAGTLERVSATAADIDAVREAYADLRRELDGDLTAADRASTAEGWRDRIAAAARPGLSRRLVLETLGATDTYALAREAITACGINTRRDHHARLERQRGRAILYLDVETPDPIPGPDAPDADPSFAAEPERPDENVRWMAAINALGALQHELTKRGLALSTDGPHETTADDLYHGHPATIIKHPTTSRETA